MLTDLRLALRTLSKARGFAAIAILTLALGLGSAVALFSTLRALVVAPLPYPQAERLVHVWSGDRWPLSGPDFRDLHEQADAFSAFGVYTPQTINVGGSQPQAVRAVRATAGVLEAFGVQPQLGRWLQPADATEGAARVLVISHDLWQQALGGAPDAVGRSLRVDGGEFIVIGVMPAGFEFAAPWMQTEACQAWLPLNLEDETMGRDSHWLCGIARLRPGTTVEAADAEIKTIGRRLTELYPNSNTNKEFLVRPLLFEMTRSVGPQVWLLFGAVILVLLVACANVASMLLARSARRQGEFAVRAALGARRGDLVRLALTESLVLAGLGAGLGLGLAQAGIVVMRLVVPATAARKAAITLDATVLGFALAAMLLTALLAGLPPALAAARTGLSGAIRGDARGLTGSQSRHRMLRSLIIAQVAVALVLANGAALFSASYFKLLEENRSLSTDLVLTARLNLRGDRYEQEEQRVQFWERLVERLGALPGVSAAGITSKLPLEGGSNTNALVNDEVYDPTKERISVERSSVTPGYFAAMGIRFIAGRNLRPGDSEGEITGVVVNRKMVERAWPDRDPLGELLRANHPTDPWYRSRVVGVVEDVRQWGPDEEVQPEMYTLPPTHWGRTINLVIRSAQPAAVLAPLVRREVAALDAELALTDVRTLREVVHRATQSERAVAGLVDFFMIVALGLVAVGLYGNLSYHVQHRTREFGIRLALGAFSRDILALVLRQGLRWVVAGTVLGILGTLALSSALQSFLYGMEGIAFWPILLAVTLVGVAAVAACWVPARRAARMDPLAALRVD